MNDELLKSSLYETKDVIYQFTRRSTSKLTLKLKMKLIGLDSFHNIFSNGNKIETCSYFQQHFLTLPFDGPQQ